MATTYPSFINNLFHKLDQLIYKKSVLGPPYLCAED